MKKLILLAFFLLTMDSLAEASAFNCSLTLRDYSTTNFTVVDTQNEVTVPLFDGGSRVVGTFANTKLRYRIQTWQVSKDGMNFLNVMLAIAPKGEVDDQSIAGHLSIGLNEPTSFYSEVVGNRKPFSKYHMTVICHLE